QEVIGNRGFPFPDGSKTGGDIQNWSLIMGGNFANGRGNVTGYAGYREVDAVLQSERDYSACAFNVGVSACGGSGTSAEGTFIIPPITDSDGNVLAAPTAPGVFYVQGNDFIGGSQVYNY